MSISSLRREFGDLVLNQLDALFRTALRMLGNREDAEDAVQSALDKAWRGLDGYRIGSSMKPWLFRILTNTCIDQLRKRTRQTAAVEDGADVDLVAAADVEFSPDELLARRELSELVEAEIARLPHWYRSVLQLVVVEQLTYEEAASVLELPVGTVRSRLSRARAKLAQALAAAGVNTNNETQSQLRVIK